MYNSQFYYSHFKLTEILKKSSVFDVISFNFKALKIISCKALRMADNLCRDIRKQAF